MSEINKSKLLNSTVYSALSESSIVFLFLLFIFAARYLGAEEFGIFSFVLAYAGLFSVINDFGLRYVLLRDISRNKEFAREIYGSTISLQLIFSICAVLIGISFMFYFEQRDEVHELMIVMLFAEAFRVAKLLLRYVYRAYEKFEVEALSVFFERLVLLSSGLIVLIWELGLYWFVFSFLLVRVCDLIISFYFTLRIITPKFYFNKDRIRYLIIESFPFCLVGVCMLLMLKVDSIMISIFRGDVEVGFYNAATKLVEGLSIISAVLINVLIPTASRHHDDPERLGVLFGICLRYVFLLSLPLVFLGVIYSGVIINFLYGEAYMASSSALTILLFGLIFTYLYSLGGAILGAINLQKVTFYASLLALTANIVANLLLIPLLGYEGAAIATVVSSVAFCIFILINLSNYSIKMNIFKHLRLPLTVTLMSGVLIYFFEFSLFLGSFLFLIQYIIILTIFGFWSKLEKETIAKLFVLVKKKLTNVVR